MSPAFDHRDPGTDEERWVAAPWWDALPDLDLDVERLLVIAAHPDDETLGAGGLIRTAAARGIDVAVVVVTDGEGSHPDSATTRNLRLERRRELLTAVDDLAPAARVSFAAVPDGGVREAADAVRVVLAGALSGVRPERTLVAVTWWGDGHRDHRVLGELARELTASGARVVGYPIWLWHWGDPDALDTAGWHALRLDDDARAAKRSALARHVSQLEPLSEAPGDEAIVSPAMRRHFERPIEVFIAASADAPSATPAAMFDDRYARDADPWGVDTRWYEQRKRRILEASLPRPRFARVLEIGCGTGALTERLAARADGVLAVDIAPHAVARAAARLTGVAGVSIEQRDVLTDWPDGSFELVVLSEVAYYWPPADVAAVLARIEAALAPGGVLVACHWRHPIGDAPLTGDAVHAAISGRASFDVLVRHVEEDFRLDVVVLRGTVRSVARESGIIA